MTRSKLGTEARRSKFGVRTDAKGKEDRTIDGILFASRREKNRYCELKLLEKAGKIDFLQIQPRFPLYVYPLQKVMDSIRTKCATEDPKEVHIGAYVADFSYNTEPGGWKEVVEDVKGMRTPLYKLKKKLVEGLYGIEIQEV